MMKKMKRKGIAGILSAVLIIAGAILIGTPGSKVLAEETIPNLDKFLHVKWQVSENPYQSDDEKTVKDLRIVSTIDADEGEKYGNVGFEITFLEDPNGGAKVPMHHRVKSVFHRIAAKEGGIKYEYGPKAFHATSEWLATCTITEIPEEYWDNGIVVKPYVTLKGSSKRYYGEHRYLTMQDIDERIITLPVEGQLTKPTVSEVDSSKVDSVYYDGYTYMRVQVDDLSDLPSISKYTVTHDDGFDVVKYRYLLSNKEHDTSWYDLEEEEDVAVIVNANEMRIFQAISTQEQYEGFAGKTIYLGADIDLNPGFNASAYSYKDKTGDAADQNWEPIGRIDRDKNMPNFAGTFDGNMHTIEGVSLIKEVGNGYGLFGQVEGATIKNFILSNSYFYVKSNETNSYTGSIVGRLTSGTIESVKCDDNVKIEIGGANQYNGGIVGKVENGTIKNCWFAGKIVSSGTHHGGIIGGLSTEYEKCTIENCLSTGNITHNRYTGDICGAAVDNTELTLINTLSAGKRSNGSGSGYKGRILGYLATTGTITAENLYANTSAGMSNNIGKESTDPVNNTIDANVTLLAYDDFKGVTGYLNIDLDYYVPEDHEDGTWVIVDGVAPHLKVFADAAGEEYIDIREIGGGTNDARTVWYKPTDDKKTFVLYSAADFRGFQTLSESNGFAGQTIYLGADIDLNPGWESSNPEGKTAEGKTAISWEPIGSSGINPGNDTVSVPKFAGIFDGDMHSISGVYLKSTSKQNRLGLFGQIDGGTVQKLILKNSYFESNHPDKGRLGGVVGYLNGIVDTVKVEDDVLVVSDNAQYVGGLVGAIGDVKNSEGDIIGGTITNSWFDGQIIGTGDRRGGILGGLYSHNGYPNPFGDISHCLVTGKIGTCNNVGGICGLVNDTDSKLTVSDSLFAGTFDGETPDYMGTVFGRAATTATIEVENVFVRKDSSILPDTGYIGSGSEKIKGDIANLEQKLDPEKLYLHDARENTGLSIYPEGQDSSADKGDKEFYWYVSEKYPVLASFEKPTTYTKLKVATYNIGYCEKIGTETSTKERVLGQVAAFIEDNEIDVCLLQEVREEDGTNHADKIANLIEGYKSYFQHTVTTSETRKEGGIAILSKYPIVGDVVFKEIVCEKSNEPRGILKIVIDMDQDKVGDAAVLCTHFDNNVEVDTKTPAIDALSSLVTEIQTETPNMPIVFGGDLNIPYAADNANLNRIGEFLTSTTAGRNANTHYLEMWYQFDYIFRNEKFTQGYTAVEIPVDSVKEEELSDHRPLVVNLYMNIQK